VVATDVGCTIEGVSFVDDGAGDAFHFTGTAAETLVLIDCSFVSTATGGLAFGADNTSGSVQGRRCTFGATTGNANEVVQLESGTFTWRECSFLHGDNTSESMVAEGDAATTIECSDCSFTGQIGSEAAVANPTFIIRQSEIEVGADHAVLVAAGNTVQLYDVEITSTEGSQDAIGGGGTVTVSNVRFLGSADEFESTLTVTHASDGRIQSGTIAAAGGSPQTDTVTLPQVFPSTNYTISLTFEATGGGADDVICSVDEGTIATTGFDVVTTSAAAAAISGNVHWIAIHD
jgi:hypothetical protein